MKKLIYLIVAIAALGFIVSGCIPVVPSSEQDESDNIEMTSVSKVVVPIVIDGILSPGEWDAYHLGTSVTDWSGGMSVDVYGYADDTYLYVAYVADKNQLGWAVAESLCVDCNLYYSTVEDGNLLDTLFNMYAPGESYQVQQTDDWVTWDDKGTLEGVSVEYFYTSMWDPPDSQGVAEFKIPLSLVAIEGVNQIELYGQYWQYDWATPFLVALPQPTYGHWVNNQRVPLYEVKTCSSDDVSSDSQIQGEVVFVDPMGNMTLVIQGNVEGLESNKCYTVWVRELFGYTGPSLDEHAASGYYMLETFTTNKKGKGKFHINILSEDLPTGTYEIQLAINDPDDPYGLYGCTVLATEAPPNCIIVTIKGQE